MQVCRLIRETYHNAMYYRAVVFLMRVKRIVLWKFDRFPWLTDLLAVIYIGEFRACEKI
jgi:hypothetical protein